MKIRQLLEVTQKNLIGHKINGRKVVPGKPWDGNFNCNSHLLTSLEGAPSTVNGDFLCSNNHLTSLEGAPSEVKGDFFCNDNNLSSLKGAPRTVLGDFFCNDNQLTSLEGAPSTVGGSFYCDYNQLTSLKGAPRTVLGDFFCDDNQLTSLEGAPSTVGGSFYCRYNHLTSLKDIHKYIKKINGTLAVYKNQIKSHVLGVFLIKGIKTFVMDYEEVTDIINKYLPEGRAGLPKAQNELIEAGYEEYAQI